MDGFILIAAAILNPRAARRRRPRAQSEESTLQDVGTRPDHPAINEINEKEGTETDKTPHDQIEPLGIVPQTCYSNDVHH